MLKRWLWYLTGWLGCLILYLIHLEWSAFIIFIAVTALPPVSLLLIYPAVRKAKAQVHFPTTLTQGESAAVRVDVTCPNYPPLWQAPIKLVHNYSGTALRLSPGDALPTAHCGTLQISVGSIYVHDSLGLFRFRLTKPQQLSIPIWPEPTPPETLPELGQKVSSRWRPRRGGGFSENHDLRLYRPGDNLQQIHWKLSAKTGNLILREPLEAIRSRLMLRLDLKGTPDALDQYLSLLLWMSRYLLSKRLPHQWQILSADGTEHFSIENEAQLLEAMSALLGRTPAAEGSVLQQPAQAAWWYYIGGDSHEES